MTFERREPVGKNHVIRKGEYQNYVIAESGNNRIDLDNQFTRQEPLVCPNEHWSVKQIDEVV